MYMIEVSEDKIDNLMEHVGKSIKCLTKVAECLEAMKEEDDYEEEYDRVLPEEKIKAIHRMGRRGLSGRYSRY